MGFGNRLKSSYALNGFITSIERLHHRTNKLMEHFLILAWLGLAWLGDLLKNKRINQREYAILEYLSSQENPVHQTQLKKTTWYQQLYRRYSPATESHNWSHLLNHSFITKSEDGNIKLNPFSA